MCTLVLLLVLRYFPTITVFYLPKQRCHSHFTHTHTRTRSEWVNIPCAQQTLWNITWWSFVICVPGVRPDAAALRPIGGESPAGSPPLSLTVQSPEKHSTFNGTKHSQKLYHWIWIQCTVHEKWHWFASLGLNSAGDQFKNDFSGILKRVLDWKWESQNSKDALSRLSLF